jgi:uncharacterized protein YfaS (alpha-2-macroglobulin family)
MTSTTRQLSVLALFLAIAVGSAVMSEEAPPSDQRATAQKAFEKGNWRDAYDIYSKLALDPKDDPKLVGIDLTQAIQCLHQLGRQKDIDELREGVIKAHEKNWRLLQTAAQSYLQQPQFGYIIAGKFERGHHRGGGEMVNSVERDRARAMQLMQQGMEAARADDDKPAASQYLYEFAQLLVNNRGHYDAWRLQVLTDLATLPDYDQGYYFYRYHQEYAGAPVDEEGKPVYHQLPKGWAESKTDGERWRWLLSQAAEIAPNRKTEIRKHFADFLWQQFGVQTMGQYGRIFGRFADDGPTKDDDTEKDESGTYALHTLGEGETIAKLANGIKRFKLPDEFNFIKIYREVADASKDNHSETSLTQLCQIFENRRQYPKAVEHWQRSIKEYGLGHNEWRKQRLDQIVGNWGRFEPDQTKPAGKGATFDFRFRNGKEVSFEAHAVAVDKLLDDVKAYIKTRPNQLEWETLNIQDIGYRLVHKDQKKYIGAKVAEWKLDLEPRENHFDKRVTATTPLQKPGAYLVRAKMADEGEAKGNTNFIVLWIADTAIVKKPIQGQSMYFVADAVTGAPLNRVNVEFFGYRQRHIRDRRFEIDIKNFAEFTSEEGQVRLKADRQPQDYQWLITARTDKGRFSYLGFDNVWYANYDDGSYNEKKIFAISDRPVYRPNQAVKFNFWTGRARYDGPEDKSEFAGLNTTLKINNPKGETVLEKQYKLDEYGGLHDEWMLPTDATLGQYYAQIIVHRGGNNDFGGGLGFRVEEYKKPEFEVTIDAPTEPVKLGEKITAKIKAKYYFGSPVSEGKVKYKVIRSSHNAEWFPHAPWDWFYGAGYWWWSYDYVWYPGWREWGCWRPYPWWRGGRWEQPELVIEREAEIGEDGTIDVEIDTGPAKAVHGDQDHKYSITAEVVDESRRTIVGTGEVLVARKPFKVHAWIDRGYVKTGDTITASFNAQTLDQKPVKGKGTLKLLKITYEDGDEPKPVETEVEKWDLDTNDEGRANQKITMREPGQYRLSYEVVDSKENKIEGGYVFTVIGEGFDGGNARFNDLELIPEKREYAPGDTVKLQINTNRAGGTVLLFMRPVNGVCPPPKLIRLKGKSQVEEITVVKNDMPNFFVEAITVSGGRVYSEAKEIVVPPEKRIVNVDIKSSAEEYKPGEKAKFVVKVTDQAGKPFIGSTVITMYDKAVEYISGGSNVPDIKEFFWKWRRHYHSYVEHNLSRYIYSIVPPNHPAMGDLGVFGDSVADELSDRNEEKSADKPGVNTATRFARGRGFGGAGGPEAPMSAAAAPMDAAGAEMAQDGASLRKNALGDASGGEGGNTATPTVRQNFADTAYWAAGITTNSDGVAEVSLDMPENLTTWKCKVWSLGHGAKVGEASTEVITRKNVIVRLQAPRFFVQKDEVVLSANVHNYLKSDKSIRVVLKLDGDVLSPLEELTRTVEVKAGGEKRVDWRVRAVREGEATIQMQALTDEESDATQMKFPVYVHGFAKTESYSGAIRPDDKAGEFTIRVPEERRPEQSRLEVRYSPTLAGAMVDALPYLADYPYGCTEQTLNRFLPTVITQKVLLDMKLDLKAIKEKRTNLNAQEIGDDVERAKGWKRFDRNPVFDIDEVKTMVKDGVDRLTEMQLSDGGWGWFSGYYEHSTPHTTAVVVHGLQVAQANDVALVPGMLDRGVKWLENYQNEQVTKIKNAPSKMNPWKDRADEIDAFVFMVLTDAGVKNADMLGFLDRDRVKLAVYAKALFGLACDKLGEKDKLAEVMKNLDQYVVHDDENQTAYLKLPADNYWWYWYGSENEAMAYYLKLLAKTDAKSKTASGLVKYLLNNRKHSTYWNSTRDTALCIEAMADYLKASGESKPDTTVEVWVDGKKVKDAKITSENLFTFDNKFVLEGEAVRAGSYKVELKKSGTGPLYYNGYLTNFTLEDPITKAGLEIKVERRYYKLVRVEKNIKAQGSRGQAVDQKVEKFDRVPLENLSTVKSGDVLEIELEIESKNDYEYIIFEDMKAAGCEPYEVRSGYGGKGLPAYIELLDNRVALFLRQLARGKHSIAYKMRAEIPGTFSALPTKASAMYAPELKANSDELKLKIED